MSSAARFAQGFWKLGTGVLPSLAREGSEVWLFFTRRRRARTLAGGTRAFSSAYHRDYEATEIRTLKGCRNSSHAAGVRMVLGLSSRWLCSLRSLTTGYSPGTPPACENGQTRGVGFSRRVRDS